MCRALFFHAAALVLKLFFISYLQPRDWYKLDEGHDVLEIKFVDHCGHVQVNLNEWKRYYMFINYTRSALGSHACQRRQYSFYIP